MKCAICKFKDWEGLFLDCIFGSCDLCNHRIPYSDYKLCEECSNAHSRCYFCGIHVESVVDLILQLDALKAKFINDHTELGIYLKQSKYSHVLYKEEYWINDTYTERINAYYEKIIANINLGIYGFED